MIDTLRDFFICRDTHLVWGFLSHGRWLWQVVHIFQSAERLSQWIGLKEKWQETPETPVFQRRNTGFLLVSCRCSNPFTHQETHGGKPGVLPTGPICRNSQCHVGTLGGAASNHWAGSALDICPGGGCESWWRIEMPLGISRMFNGCSMYFYIFCPIHILYIWLYVYIYI